MPHWQIPLCIWANLFLGLRLAESSDWSHLCINTSPQLNSSWHPYCWDSTDYVCMNRTSGKLLLLLFRWLLHLPSPSLVCGQGVYDGRGVLWGLVYYVGTTWIMTMLLEPSCSTEIPQFKVSAYHRHNYYFTAGSGIPSLRNHSSTNHILNG